MIKYLLIGLAGLALTACATTDESASSAAVPAATAQQETTLADGELDPNAEVCRSVSQSGTRFRTRVCKTRAEWERDAREARDATVNMQRTVEPNTGPN